MRRLPWLVPLVTFCVLALTRTGDAGRIDSTSWNLAGSHKSKIGRSKPVKTVISDGSLLVGLGVFTAANLPTAYTGTYADKGRRGFTATTDAPGTQSLTDYFVDRIKTSTGASAVDVLSIAVKITGVVSKDGSVLRAKTKITLKGTITILGFQRPGKVTDTGRFRGTQPG